MGKWLDRYGEKAKKREAGRLVHEKPSLQSGWGRCHWTDNNGSMHIDWIRNGVRIPVDDSDLAEFLARKNPAPMIREKSVSKDSPMLNIMDPNIRKKPQLELLTEVETEAFNGWYSTMRKPRFNLSHDEASLRAWGYLMDSMHIMYREGRGRYKPHE